MPEASLARSAAALDDAFADDIATQIRAFLLSLREIARDGDPAIGVPLLLLEVSQLMLAGGRLGAIDDVVPNERFEPDAGVESDLDELRDRLATMLTGLDEYIEVFDPYTPNPEFVTMRMSDDLADVASNLQHGLAHYAAGRKDEALFWWQFGYLSSWGAEAGAVLRALHSIAAHSRTDSDRPDPNEADVARL
jgi:Domain of unknown function (DUF5063)